ncbi:MAG: heavy metal translocating P-type ATPase [Promethearchaeota archaeon]
MNEKFRKGIILFIELVLCVLNGIFLFVFLLPDSEIWWLGSYANLFGLISFTIGGVPVIIESIWELFRKNLTADILFSIALVATLYLEDFFAVSILIIMMGAGEFVEEWTIDRAHGNLESLLELQPDICHKKINMQGGNNNILDVTVGDIVPEDIIIVKQGERIAVDGFVVNGSGSLDQSALNGESIPILKQIGDSVMSGSLVVEGYLEIKCSVPASESSIEKVIELVKKAQEEKSEFQTLTDKWAQIFAPLILITAFMVWLITQNLYFAITVLVVACPCALVLSVPTAFMAAIANASRHGVWIKSGSSIETIGEIDTVMLDKTGTLTTGNLLVSELISINPKYSEREILEISAILEYFSSHPVAKCLLKNCKDRDIIINPPFNFETIIGIGIKGVVNDTTYYLGNKRLFELEELDLKTDYNNFTKTFEVINKFESSGKLNLFLTSQSEVLGVIALEDELREEVSDFIVGLKKLGIKKIGILSGDSKNRSDVIAESMGIDFVRAELKPKEKYQIVQAELDTEKKVVMIGDGINDAPSLALASVGIAIGIGGTALAVEQADMILLDDNISNLVDIFYLGKRTTRKSKINIALAIFLNIIGIFLSIYGILNPISAAGWHIAQSLIVVVNSTFLLRNKINTSKSIKLIK